MKYYKGGDNLGKNTESAQGLSNQLDFSIEDTEERLQLLYEITMEYNEAAKEWMPNKFLEDFFTNYYNSHIKQTQGLAETVAACRNLSYIAGYILFNKGEPPIDVVKTVTQKKRDLKHISFESTIEEAGEAAVEPVKSNYTKPKVEITEEDIEKYQPVADYTAYLKELQKKQEEDVDGKRMKLLKKTIKEVAQDRVAMKIQLTRPILFSKLTKSDSEIDFYQNTGYVDNKGEYKLVSENTIDLKDPKHIKEILKRYSELKQHIAESPHADMRYILDAIDDIIEKAPINEHFKFILIKRIDGMTYEQIAEELQKKLGLRLSESYISSVFLNRIPDIMVEYYLDSYEEWYYTFKQKGDYKTCSRQISPDCQKNYLRTTKYFRKDKKSPDGLSTVCKTCRKMQDLEAKKRRSA